MATTTTDGPASGTKLKRGITTLLLFFFIVGDTLGAGIYTLVGRMAGDVGGAIWIPLVLALVLALLTAGTYAELITKYPHAGGAARFAERAFDKPYVTFLIGFLMLSSGITTSAALANAFAGDYLQALVPGISPIPVTLVFIALLVLVNIRGVRESLMANVGATLIEMTGLIIIIAVAAIVFGSGNGDPSRLTTFAEGVPPLTGAFAATITAFFSFLGFEAAANMAEEVKDPSRSYPRALFGAILTAAVVYLLIAVGAAIVVPIDQLATSEGPLLEVIEASGLAFPPWLFAIIALVAIGNGALLFMVMASRATYGLAEAKLLPKAFGAVLSGRRTPWVAIVVVGAVTMAMSFIGDVGTLADTTVLLLVLVFISANVSVLVLKKDKVAHKHFTAPRIVSVLALIASIALLTQQSLQTWLIAGAYVVVGTILFLIARAARRREHRLGTAEPTRSIPLE
ncbi:APC family permease [Agrococcus jenensis]|uniref:Amino acid/polyamine/organocation transporter (APC superfamily) n=1 Tax=Agrococcus jenensis TaxID=46353 RepID=A0A3N2ASP5_9MICO|nr:APC family permease [Agrococcus jenensis]ROR66067.1 amino acid/polyamine/organocation transporter (APC superfamily) [Agrococcus jenensis]